MAKRKGNNYSLLLMIILLIMAVIPGLVYIIFHPVSRVLTLILLFICAILPGILYLLWPSGGFRG